MAGDEYEAEAMKVADAYEKIRNTVLYDWEPIAAALRAAHIEGMRRALLICDVCGRETGGCCAVVVDSTATKAVDRYRAHIRAAIDRAIEAARKGDG